MEFTTSKNGSNASWDQRRLEELRRYAILDTPHEPGFDDLAKVAAIVCGTPIAAISLIDEKRQWFKANYGLSVRETELSVSFCKNAIEQRGIYQIENAAIHPQYINNPLVTGDPHIRFYASCPLITDKGIAIGTLLVIDHVPRSLNEEQREVLTMLARQVMLALELHREKAYLRQRLDEQSEDHAALYELAADVSDVCFWSKERGNARLSLSSEAQTMLGVQGEVQPTIVSLAGHMEPSLRTTWESSLLDWESQPGEIDLEGEWTLPDGTVRCMRWIAIRKPSSGQTPMRLLGLVIDITEQKRIEREVAEVLERLKFSAALLDQASDAIFVKNLQHQIEFWNAGAERLFGWTASEVVGRSAAKLLDLGPTFTDELIARLEEQEDFVTEIMARRKDGEVLDVLAHFTRVHDEKGKPRAIFTICTDITQTRRDRQRIHQLAFYDQLTQLPNRTLLTERVQRALASGRRHREYGALMFIDLDNFKNLNDTLGHAVGDELLKQVASRLQSSVRAIDTVARLGGDEFVVLLEELGKDAIRAARQADTASRKVQSTLRQPFMLGEYAHLSTSSIGVSLFEGKTIGLDELLKQADIAMYEAKQAGRDGVRFFDPGMQQMVNERVLLENALRRAEIQDEFTLYYQPQWHRDSSLAGFEALVRWNHPTRGLLEPAEFITAAEETGVILLLGRWVLDHACRQIAQWCAVYPTVRVSVNISAAQLRNPAFVNEVREALRRHSASAACLSLELTESMLVSDVNLTIRKMRELKAMGVRIALDDFGTGYSSLSLLQRLPLDYLKIDSSFVHQMGQGIRESKMVQSIVSMGKNLELEIIAEGVETEGQQTLLETFGCDEFQGYLLGRSMPASEASQLVNVH